jgi:hypothetical protein
MPSLPSPVRVAIGLAATVLDEAKSLPDKSIELPMLAVSRALQFSLRAQQRYSSLAARGDEVLAARRTTDEPPPWATFDEPVENGVSGPAAAPAASAEASRRPRPHKGVTAPRIGSPSPFDAAGDEE